MTLKFISETPEPDEPPCIGRFFRFIETGFSGKNGRMVFSKELRPLRSISCRGCKECGTDDDSLKEALSQDPLGGVQFSAHLEHGDTARLEMVVSDRDHESGAAEAWYYEAVPVQKEEKKA